MNECQQPWSFRRHSQNAQSIEIEERLRISDSFYTVGSSYVRTVMRTSIKNLARYEAERIQRAVSRHHLMKLNIFNIFRDWS